MKKEVFSFEKRPFLGQFPYPLKVNFFYYESKFKIKKIVGVGGGGGGYHGWTDKQAQTNLPLVGITMHKCTSYGPDKLNL